MDFVLSHKISLVAGLAGKLTTINSTFSFRHLYQDDNRAWHFSWNPIKPSLAICSADKLKMRKKLLGYLVAC